MMHHTSSHVGGGSLKELCTRKLKRRTRHTTRIHRKKLVYTTRVFKETSSLNWSFSSGKAVNSSITKPINASKSFLVWRSELAELISRIWACLRWCTTISASTETMPAQFFNSVELIWLIISPAFCLLSAVTVGNNGARSVFDEGEINGSGDPMQLWNRNQLKWILKNMKITRLPMLANQTVRNLKLWSWRQNNCSMTQNNTSQTLKR